MMGQVFGACNNQKQNLVECLHAERMDRQKRHLEKSIERRKAINNRWKEMEEEEYGPGGYLKEVQKKKSESNNNN